MAFDNDKPSQSCSDKMENFFGKHFERFGHFVATHPWKIILIVTLVNGALGIGMLRLNYVIDVQKVYTPIGSQSSKDSDKVRSLFPDASGTLFLGYQMPNTGRYGEVVVKSKMGNVMSSASLTELAIFYSFLWDISTTDESGAEVRLGDICAKAYGNCSIDGNLFVDPEFVTAASAGTVGYPFFIHSQKGPLFYEQLVGGASISNGVLSSAVAFMFRINLRTDSDYYIQTAKKWQVSFIEKLKIYHSSFFDIAYSHSDSLSEELNANVTGDITFFSLTFTLMITYACVATITARRNCVGQRAYLGYGGVVAAGLSLVSAFGLGSLCGLDFVSIVGVVPFLIIGIGVDDMFMLMSGMAQTDPKASVEERIGKTMRTSGISITITSLTDLLAFAAGASSVFLSVRNFCIYSAIAVLFCYINQATFFLACLAINEKRTEQNRHFATCLPVKKSSDSAAYNVCCAGKKPTDKGDAESFLDKVPKYLFPKIIASLIAKVVIAFLFVSFLGVSIWGITRLKQGLELKNLVSESSYYYNFQDNLDKYFPGGTYISLVFDDVISYADYNNQNAVEGLIAKVKDKSTVQDNVEINWLASYKLSSGYVNTSESAFITGLKTFLSIQQNQRFLNDIVIDSAKQTILASRIHLISESIKDSQEQGQFMLGMRELVDGSSLPVFVFSPSFVYYEQYLIILSQTLQTVGIAVGMIFLVTCIFMPHPLLLVYMTITVAMITTGVFGFLSFIGLTLSSVTMIHIIMSIGFSVDFSAHICHGYNIADGKNKQEKVENGLKSAGIPIFHGAISSILGVVLLAFAKSYIFYSFFQVMSLVITFGILHAVLLLPVVLSLEFPPTKPYVKSTNSRTNSSQDKGMEMS